MKNYIWLILLIPVLFVLDVLVGGSTAFGLSDLTNLFSNEAETINSILVKSRLPKAIMAILAGAGLSLSGLLMQTYFRNPLAGPSVLGLTSGASLGVAISIMGVSAFGITAKWLGQFSNIVFAIVGALLVLLIITIVAKRLKSIGSLLIFGLMLGYITSSVVTVLSYFSSEKALKSFAHWGFGNFGNITKFSDRYTIILIASLIVLIGAVIIFLQSKQLNGWLLGPTYAKSIGVNTKKTGMIILLVCGLLTAIITALCGPIAFLGLAVPHIAKGWLKTSNHFKLIPLTLLVGICLALLCDIVAAVPGFEVQLPVNAITSIVGAPIVIFIIIRSKSLA